MSWPRLWKITVNAYNPKHCDETKLRAQHLCDVTYNNLSQRTTKPTIRRATSEDSDQPAYPRSLIRVFADRICLPQPLGYPKRDERESLPYWEDVQADLKSFPVSILYKSIAGRYRPVRVADGLITARYRFIKNAYWVAGDTYLIVGFVVRWLYFSLYA